MKTGEYASLPLMKVITISLIIIFVLGVGVMAVNTQINSVEIKYSNGTDINILTGKTKVSEILEENHIILLPDEVVTPGLDSEITESKRIKISKVTDEEVGINEIVSESQNVSIDELMDKYAPITEKIVTEQVEIPFETITKDVSSGSNDTQSKVLTEGKNGLKEVTYRVKYQNDIEIEKTEISSTIITEPVNKVVQVKKKPVVTSRSSESRTASNSASSSGNSLASRVEGKTPVVKNLNASAYCSCAQCCGKSTGKTSSGAYATAWYTLAAGSGYPIGTVIYIPYFKNKPNGGWFRCV